MSTYFRSTKIKPLKLKNKDIYIGELKSAVQCFHNVTKNSNVVFCHTAKSYLPDLKNPELLSHD